MVTVLVVLVAGIGLLLAQTVGASNPAVASARIGFPSADTTTAPAIVLGLDVVSVTPPKGWDHHVGGGGTWASMFGEHADMRVEIERDKTVDAAGATSNLADAWVRNADHYSNVTTSGSTALNAPGTKGAQRLDYDAVYTDSGGAFSEHGELFTGVRADGWVLEIKIDAYGSDAAAAAKQFEATRPDFDSVIGAAYKSFGGQ
jgi:hypothetical protein